MVRSTGMHLVLPAVLCFAANSLAADTGIPYVKSFPAGATVVIGGKERGKTTVEANKVATMNVAIEVPSATLTIISHPLEATVILDGRDAGKTPVTLEHLDPGEHRPLRSVYRMGSEVRR